MRDLGWLRRVVAIIRGIHSAARGDAEARADRATPSRWEGGRWGEG